MNDATDNRSPAARANPVVPYLWMLCGALAFAVMSTLAHAVRDRFSWQAIAIGRSSVPFVLTGLSALFAGGQLVLLGPKALWLRSLAGSTSLVCTFFALTRLPVADALTLTNLFPIWVALLSWPMLRQRPGLFVWGCAVCAVCGVVMIQQPHLADGNLATLGALFASCTSALAMIGLHRVQGLDTRAIVWHFSGVSLLFAGSAMWLLDGRLPGQSLPVRSPGGEVGGGEVQEQGQPADRHPGRVAEPDAGRTRRRADAGSGQPSSAFISAISALWPATIRWQSCLLSGS